MTTKSRKKLTPEQQNRVDIAKDALAWARAGALKIAVQRYVINPKTDTAFRPSDFHPSDVSGLDQLYKQARDVVLGQCQVCALGGLLLAKAVRFDAVQVSDILNCNVGRLLDHFSAVQINNIEAAFEGISYPSQNGTADYNTYFDLVNQEWKEAFPNDFKRFSAIMKNIIRNDGDFVPTDMRS